MQFSEDDRNLACCYLGAKFGLIEVIASSVYRHLPSTRNRHLVYGLSLSPDNRLIAVACEDGLCFWDLATGQEIGLLPLSGAGSVRFSLDGDRLLACGASGLLRWPIQRVRHGQEEEVRIGQAQAIHPRTSTHMGFASFSGDGNSVAAVVYGHPEALVLDVWNPTNLVALRPHARAQYIAMSADGTRVATGTWKGSDVKIWEAHTGRLEQTLSLPGSQDVLFSPNGRWLITAGGDDYRLWRVASWRRQASVSASRFVGVMAFSPDSKLLAIARTGGGASRVRLRPCTAWPSATVVLSR